jgi:hypothetical protein
MEEGKLHGMGCVLDARHVITARHVYKEIQNLYSWPVILKHDGLFKCEIVLDSAAYDIMVLRTVELVAESDHPAPEAYPELSEKLPFVGMNVGLISSLQLYQTIEDSTMHTYFASADVAFFQRGDEGKGISFALSGCIIQKGFSGSPVFRSDGSLIGVLIQALSFRAEFHDTKAPIYTLPVMSPIAPLHCQISALLREGQ